MCNSLTAPITQILDNAGHDLDDIIEGGLFGDVQGYDVKNNQYGDMFEMGIVDPAKVTKNALRNAVSVATTILGTNAIITMARSYETSK
jgi:chaperonin GroEL